MSHYEFLGRMLGKALYEGILVELRFAGFFLNKILGRNNYRFFFLKKKKLFISKKINNKS